MRYIIIGGAGFIGSHFTNKLLENPENEVTIYDNFSSGKHWYYEQHINNPRLEVFKEDVNNFKALTSIMYGHDIVIHLASNPDIARAANEPDIDFYAGTLLTQNVIEAMRRAYVPKILYASGSGVYGELGEIEGHENYGPLIPVSTYGSSKLAGEAMISAYSAMFGIKGIAFRFGNVVGARQTHGVGLDFLKRLMEDNTQLRILGNGTQSKSYVHVSDIVNAVLLASEKTKENYKVYNVATLDYITVNEIAEIAIEVIGAKNVKLLYTGGDRGWKGDVPIVRLSSKSIREIGWTAQTAKQAIRRSLEEMLPDIKEGKI